MKSTSSRGVVQAWSVNACAVSIRQVTLAGTRPLSDTPIEDAIAKIEAEMLKVVNTETTRANLFKDGKMFYSVPIEHLRRHIRPW